MWKFFGICWIIFLPGGGTIPYSKHSRMVVSFNVLAKNIIYFITIVYYPVLVLYHLSVRVKKTLASCLRFRQPLPQPTQWHGFWGCSFARCQAPTPRSLVISSSIPTVLRLAMMIDPRNESMGPTKRVRWQWQLKETNHLINACFWFP